LSADLIAALEDRSGTAELTRRDLAEGIPFVDEAWIEANFTPDDSRTQKHVDTLAYSDELIGELD
jgi:FMN-dependent NADH-azoreductase